MPELPFPHILGADAAGVVTELGEGVNGFEFGESVIVAPGYPQKEEETNIRPTVTAPSFALPGLHISGTYTQFMEVPAYALIKDETGLKPEEVATLPVVLATAVHSLKEIGEVKAGDKVLIHSGASGSGSMQIQVAKALGADVAFGFSAGTEVKFDIRSLFFAQKTLRGSMASDIEDLNWGLEQVRVGRIKPLLDLALPLSKAAEAHRLISNNEVSGNIVLLPWAS